MATTEQVIPIKQKSGQSRLVGAAKVVLLIAVFVGVVAFGILVVGYLFNFIF
jgi:hypothetical protein